MIYQFICPYCDHKNELTLDCVGNKNHAVTYCDKESGGCDKQLVLTYWVEAKTIVRRIQGENI